MITIYINYKGLIQSIKCESASIKEGNSELVFTEYNDYVKCLINFVNAAKILTTITRGEKTVVSIPTKHLQTNLFTGSNFTVPVCDDNYFDAISEHHHKLNGARNHANAIKHKLNALEISLKGYETSIADCNAESIVGTPLIAANFAKSRCIKQRELLNEELIAIEAEIAALEQIVPFVEQVIIKRSIREYVTVEQMGMIQKLFNNMHDHALYWKWQKELLAKLDYALSNNLTKEFVDELLEIIEKKQNKLKKYLK